MGWLLIVTGIVIGIAVAAPIGPINLMAIQRTLAHGFRSGVSTGIGAVLGDGTFALIAAFGLTAISSLLLEYSAHIQLIGGAAMTIIGLRTMAVRPEPVAHGKRGQMASHMSLIGSTYFLTITNPATMLGFAAIFSGLGTLVNRPGDYWGAGLLVAAVMAGSLMWWLLLAWFVSLVRDRVTESALRIINIGSGTVIAVFGVAVLVRVLFF